MTAADLAIVQVRYIFDPRRVIKIVLGFYQFLSSLYSSLLAGARNLTVTIKGLALIPTPSRVKCDHCTIRSMCSNMTRCSQELIVRFPFLSALLLTWRRLYSKNTYWPRNQYSSPFKSRWMGPILPPCITFDMCNRFYNVIPLPNCGHMFSQSYSTGIRSSIVSFVSSIPPKVLLSPLIG